MSLIIEDPEVERLVAEVAAATGESETDAIRTALRAQKEKIEASSLQERVRQFREKMEREVWSKLPPEVRGKPMTKDEKEGALGYTPGLGYTDHEVR